jgi:hypothetical protein
MVSICRELGFEISTGSGGDTVQAELSLPA